MNQTDAARWKSQVLDEVFVALAASKPLEESLVFKGARVLNAILGDGRQSLDLDSNLAERFVQECPNRGKQRDFLETEMTRAVHRHFEEQDPVRYELKALTVRSYPPKSHPMGWDAFKVKLEVNDLSRRVRSLPAIEIDVAAPEQLLSNSLSTLQVGGYRVHAYTLERIAGEKLRAFLSSLPANRAKMKKPGEAVRAKDLYDLSRIRRVRALDQIEFWRQVGQEFQVACRSRYIDCEGLPTFRQEWEVTRNTYDQPTIPKDIAFDEVEATISAIAGFLEAHHFVPFTCPLPPSS